MKQIFPKMLTYLFTIILVLFLIILLILISSSLYREYKINTISDFIYMNNSGSKNSTLKIFQKGGDSIVSVTTPMDVVCYSNGSITTGRHYVKMGHIYKNKNGNGINVTWNAEENGGIVSFGSRPPISFTCK